MLYSADAKKVYTAQDYSRFLARQEYHIEKFIETTREFYGNKRITFILPPKAYYNPKNCSLPRQNKQERLNLVHQYRKTMKNVLKKLKIAFVSYEGQLGFDNLHNNKSGNQKLLKCIGEIAENPLPLSKNQVKIKEFHI